MEEVTPDGEDSLGVETLPIVGPENGLSIAVAEGNCAQNFLANVKAEIIQASNDAKVSDNVAAVGTIDVARDNSSDSDGSKADKVDPTDTSASVSATDLAPKVSQGSPIKTEAALNVPLSLEALHAGDPKAASSPAIELRNKGLSMAKPRGSTHGGRSWTEDPDGVFQKHVDKLLSQALGGHPMEDKLAEPQRTGKTALIFTKEDSIQIAIEIYEMIFEDERYGVCKKFMRNTKISVKEMLCTKTTQHIGDAMAVPWKNYEQRVPYIQLIKRDILECIGKFEKQSQFQLVGDLAQGDKQVKESVDAAQPGHPFDAAIERVFQKFYSARHVIVQAELFLQMERGIVRLEDEPGRIELLVDTMAYWPAEHNSEALNVVNQAVLSYFFVRVDMKTNQVVPLDEGADGRKFKYQHRIAGLAPGRTIVHETSGKVGKSWLVTVVSPQQRAKHEEARRKEALAMASKKSTWWNRDAPEHCRKWKHLAGRDNDLTDGGQMEQHTAPSHESHSGLIDHGDISEQQVAPTKAFHRNRPRTRRQSLDDKDLFEIMSPLFFGGATNISPRQKVWAEDAIDYLVRHGRSLDIWSGPATPLRSAVHFQRNDIVELLLASRANPNESNHEGVSVLHMAVWEDSLKMVETLLRCRADPQLEDWEGQSPLFFIATPAMGDLLLAYKASITFTNKRKQTPLHHACRAGKKPVIEWFINQSSSLRDGEGGSGYVRVRDAYGASAAYYAAQAGLSDRYLVEHRVKTS